MFNKIQPIKLKNSKISVFILLMVFARNYSARAQQDTLLPYSVYRLNRKIEIPLNLVHHALNYSSYQILLRKSIIDERELTNLNTDDVWFFDRHAVKQAYSPKTRENALVASDVLMNGVLLLPFSLLFNREIKSDAMDILFLYLETQAVNLSLSYAGPLLTNRKRPFVYYEEIPISEKLRAGSTDSFFSGHTSSTAAATFFMAKVYTDYHPETAGKKWIFYTAALVPPVFEGYFRYKGLKHFPTDILTGIAVGAASGILVPHFHRKALRKQTGITLTPYTGSTSGIIMQYKF